MRNLQIAQEGQITERFTRAIQQLGSDQMEVRLGGIYGLERIARDSARDHWPIMEILTAYLRTHARWQEEPGGQPATPRTDDEERSEPIFDSIMADDRQHSRIGQQERLRTDIQAILTVLGRRIWTREREDQRLNLSRLDLRGALLIDACLKTPYSSGHTWKEHTSLELIVNERMLKVFDAISMLLQPLCAGVEYRQAEAAVGDSARQRRMAKFVRHPSFHKNGESRS